MSPKNKSINDQDIKDINDAVESAEGKPAENDSIDAVEEQTALTVAAQQNQLSVGVKGVGIQGMEDIPISMMAVPFVKLVQPTSTKVEVSEGKDAEQGSFYFTDIQKSVPQLEFIMLRAKKSMVQFKRDGELQRPQPRVYILGLTLNTGKLFILSLSATSFSGFGKLIAKFKNDKIDKTWRFSLTATSQKQENEKGKYYTADFEIGAELSEDELAEMDIKAAEYGLALDRAERTEEELVTN